MHNEVFPLRKAAVLVASVGLLVGIGALMVVSQEEQASPPRSRCGTGFTGSFRLSSYEWRQSAWGDPGARGELIDRARGLCLDRLYVDVTAAGSADAVQLSALGDDLARLVSDAASKELEVGVVAGDPWWFSDAGQADVARLLTFVDGLVDEGVAISSLHLDVEPWGLEEWADSKAELIDAYLRFVSWVEGGRSESGRPLPVVYLIPYWFDGSNGEVSPVDFAGRSAVPFDHLTSLIGDGGSVSVMAYRDRAEGDGGIIDLLRHETGQRQVPVLVGVETADIEPPTATFAGSSPDELQAQLQLVADATATDEIVVNDIVGLGRLADNATPSTN